MNKSWPTDNFSEGRGLKITSNSISCSPVELPVELPGTLPVELLVTLPVEISVTLPVLVVLHAKNVKKN